MRDPKTPFTADEMARSFVTAFLKAAQKEVTLRVLVKTAQTLADNAFKYDARAEAKKEACSPERITQAAKDLSKWNQIVLVSHDTYCLPQFMPKYRTLDDTWMS